MNVTAMSKSTDSERDGSKSRVNIADEIPANSATTGRDASVECRSAVSFALSSSSDILPLSNSLEYAFARSTRQRFMARSFILATEETELPLSERTVMNIPVGRAMTSVSGFPAARQILTAVSSARNVSPPFSRIITAASIAVSARREAVSGVPFNLRAPFRLPHRQWSRCPALRQ